MLNFLNSFENNRASWDINFPNWSKFGDRVYQYCSGIKKSQAPWYGKVLKVVCDIFDMVTYNAYAFMGMLLCACLLF